MFDCLHFNSAAKIQKLFHMSKKIVKKIQNNYFYHKIINFICLTQLFFVLLHANLVERLDTQLAIWNKDKRI